MEKHNQWELWHSSVKNMVIQSEWLNLGIQLSFAVEHMLKSTGTIGIVKIVSEGAIAAGVRRIEAVTASKAEEYINEKLNTIDEIAALLKSTGNITESVEKLIV